MTSIRSRVAGAFIIVLCLLLSVGVNAYFAIAFVDRQATDVQRGLERTSGMIDFIVKVRTVIAHGSEYVLSESEADRAVVLRDADDLRLAADGLETRVPGAAPSVLRSLRDETGIYVSDLARVISLVRSRQSHTAEVSNALTDLHVLATAILDRARGTSDLMLAAGKTLARLDAAGASAFRYRSSRDPTDIDTAKRWLDLADAAFRVDGMSANLPATVAPLIKALSDAKARFAAQVRAMEHETLAIGEASAQLRQAGDQLLGQSVAERSASAADQIRATERMRAAISGARSFNIIATLLALVSGGGLAFALVRSIALPLAAITGAMRKLASGVAEAPIPYASRNDEIGAVAKAVVVFRDGLLKVRTLDAEREREHSIKQSRIERMDALNRSFEVAFAADTMSFAEAATNMVQISGVLREIASQTHDRSTIVASAAKHASASVNLVAINTEQISASISEIGVQLEASAGLTADTATHAKKADVNVRALEAGAKKIGEVVSLIHKIAQETNLLALNATIEAARAGEAGKGFAVVASEVKQLAVATERATREIDGETRHIQQAMQLAAATIEEIRSAIGAIDRGASDISGAIDEQSRSIDQIAANAAKAAIGAENVTLNIVDVLQAADSTDKTARDLYAAAEVMTTRAEAMKLRVSDYLRQQQQ